MAGTKEGGVTDASQKISNDSIGSGEALGSTMDLRWVDASQGLICL